MMESLRPILGARRRTAGSRWGVALVLLLFPVFFAQVVHCAHRGGVSPQGHASPIVWPPAPNKGRIRLVGSLPIAQEQGKHWFFRLIDFVAGVDAQSGGREEMVRPQGIALLQDAIWVADPGAGGLWRLDMQTGALKAVHVSNSDGDPCLVAPTDLALGSDDRLYVADPEAGGIIVLTRQGECVGYWGRGVLMRPTAVVWLQNEGVLAVADAGAHRITLLARDGRLLRHLGARGRAPGEFNFPTHLAQGTLGELLVVDALNSRVQAIDAATGRAIDRLGELGDVPGTLNKPKGVAVDSEAHVYVVDALQDQVFIFSRAGDFLLGFGARAGTDSLALPAGIAIDAFDRIYVADSLNRRIQVFQYLRSDTLARGLP